MQAGGIVETGTHSQLMAKGGAYAVLYQVAAQSHDPQFAETSPL
jgi:ABC-type multidrug transport system fused ATPase/permease subunit